MEEGIAASMEREDDALMVFRLVVEVKGAEEVCCCLDQNTTSRNAGLRAHHEE